VIANALTVRRQKMTSLRSTDAAVNRTAMGTMIQGRDVAMRCIRVEKG